MFALINGYLIDITKITYLSDINEVIDNDDNILYGFELGMGGESLPILFKNKEKALKAYNYLFNSVTDNKKLINITIKD